MHIAPWRRWYCTMIVLARMNIAPWRRWNCTMIVLIGMNIARWRCCYCTMIVLIGMHIAPWRRCYCTMIVLKGMHIAPWGRWYCTMIVLRLMNRVDDEVQRKQFMHIIVYLQCSSSLLSHQSCKRECLSGIVVKASLILEKKPKNGRRRFNHGFILVFKTFFPFPLWLWCLFMSSF